MLIHYLVPLLIGIATGFIGGLFGIGGGIVAIPALAFLGHTQQVAQGTSLVMQVPNAALGMWQYMRRGTLDVRAGSILAVCALPMTYAGAFTATHMPSPQLRVAFGIFFALLATFSLWSGLRSKRRSAALLPLSWPLVAALGLLAGFTTGLFGIGGPALAVQALVTVFGLTQTAAQGMGLFLILPALVVNLATYGVAGDIDWGAGIALAFGGSILVSAGVALAHHLPERTMRVLFAGLLYAMSIVLELKR